MATRRKAIVTGGSTGIGRAIAIALARSGHDVAFTYLDQPDESKKTAEAVREAGGNCLFEQLDLTQPEAARACVDRMVEQLGGLDVFVNNAGMMVRKTIADVTLADANRIFNVNAFGAVLAIQQAIRHMLPDGVDGPPRESPGRIVVVTSVHEYFANPTDLLYTMTKHALGGLVKCLALELTPLNVTVNAVAPGEIATPMNDMTAEDHHDKRPGMPAGRPGHPHEVARVVDFLASPESDFITGSSWPVDGGFIAATPMASAGLRED